MGGNIILAQHKIDFSYNQPTLLEVNAGNDTILFSNSQTQLGGNPVVWGGTTEYIYSWEPVLLLDNASIDHPIISSNADTTFYLTVTDGRGCTATDEVVISRSSVDNLSYDYIIKDIVLSPNPVRDKLTINIASASKPMDCNIYIINSSGGILLNQYYFSGSGNTSEYSISISDIPDGYYYVRIVGNDFDVSKPFIKN